VVEEALGGVRVVGVDDGVVDGVVESFDGFALAADFEAMVGGGDGGGDEPSGGDRVRDGPIDVGDPDGVVFGDVAE
jgi:hypothetical protein